MWPTLIRGLHVGNTSRVGVDNIVREVDEKLRETAFSSRVVTQDARKGCVSEGFGEALAKRLACSGVITQADTRLAVVLAGAF